jgi:UTP:GlnB (protein PII) uridylyltransferase
MTPLSEIEAAIQKLPEEEVRHLATWLEDYLNELWDRQIETDLAAGKLDALIAQAEADIAANQVRELDEILYNP